jgi:hypothetical protein
MSRAGELRLTTLERMVADGLLDESDGDEVAGTLELLAERYAIGDITEHFALHVIEKMALEARPKYLRRRWGVYVESEGKERG